MRLTIIAKPKKKQEKVIPISSTSYAVSVQEPPIDGRANDAIIRALAKYFSLSPSQFIIVSGHTAKIKIIEAPDFLVNFEPNFTQKSLFKL